MKPSYLLIFPVIAVLAGSCNADKESGTIITVKGPVSSKSTGIWLTHEHILVDFIGADSANPSRYDRKAVITKALPYLMEVRRMGCGTFVDCTPEYIGRDPLILKALSDSTGVNILTNTGYYGAVNNKYIPDFAFNESAEELSRRWIDEWKNGIGNTRIKPGFIKIGVNKDSLSEFHAKLVRAAALTHLRTGMTIASHTGPSVPAFQQLEILKKEGVSPEAFIWVHAQAEHDISKLAEAASTDAWISLDNLNEKNIDYILSVISALKEKGYLNRILVSHDAGWYDPAKENGGEFRGYNTMFEKLIPAMKEKGFAGEEIEQVFLINPSNAYSIKVRKL
jgi:phosphotriesterase-related protein